MKKPNFFILGAPKCGTTSLAAWLSQHPSVFFSPLKEPHFFNTDGLTDVSSLSDYEKLFSGVQPHHKAVGEGSTHYLYSQEALPNILEYNPDARFIVCLRNPLEMAPALHRERLIHGRETEPNFELAWKLQKDREKGFFIPRAVKADPDRLQYGKYCKLGEQLRRVLSYVDETNILIITLDDIRKDPSHIFTKVLEFLDIADGTDKESLDFTPHNTRKFTRSIKVAQFSNICRQIKLGLGIRYSFGILRQINRINTKSQGVDNVPLEVLEEMKDYFYRDLELLSNLTGRNFLYWVRNSDNSYSPQENVAV